MPARGAATSASVPTTSEPTDSSKLTDSEINWEKVRSLPLAQKLAFVMGEVQYVQKRGWNDFHKYNYVTEGDLTAKVRPLLAKAGIIIVPSVVEEIRYPDAVQERNGTSALTSVTMEFTVSDGNDSISFRIPGHGADKSDKGIYKAMTGATKYALMKLFLVETGDDPERESGAHEEPVQNVSITSSDEEGIEKGGRSTKATRYQLQRISSTMREKGIERKVLLDIIKNLFEVELVLEENDEPGGGQVILAFLKELDNEDAGKLVKTLDEYEVKDAAS